MINGVLKFVRSKHPPVFEKEEIFISFSRLPMIGESFVFSRRDHIENGHTSAVEKVDVKDGAYRITTRNSVYELLP